MLCHCQTNKAISQILFFYFVQLYICITVNIIIFVIISVLVFLSYMNSFTDSGDTVCNMDKCSLFVCEIIILFEHQNSVHPVPFK